MKLHSQRLQTVDEIRAFLSGSTTFDFELHSREEAFDGTVTLLYRGRALPYRLLQEGEPPAPLADEKSVRSVVEQAKADRTGRPRWKPAADHPWRRSSAAPAGR